MLYSIKCPTNGCAFQHQISAAKPAMPPDNHQPHKQENAQGSRAYGGVDLFKQDTPEKVNQGYKEVLKKN